MIHTVEPRDYIKNFLDFTMGFLVTENATINDINLVEANIDILKKRIQSVKEEWLFTYKDGLLTGRLPLEGE